MSLHNYLNKYNINDYEGNCSNIPKQMEHLISFVNDFTVKNILEIGFNAGHSSELFLSHSLANVVSFDLNQRPCVDIAKKYIDTKFPLRHTLIKGDSTKMVPEYYKNNKNITFDIIFINRGLQYDIAYSDICNCKLISHKDTIVIVDDIVLNKDLQTDCSLEPTLAWSNANINSIVEQHGYEIYSIGRGMVWGKYL